MPVTQAYFPSLLKPLRWRRGGRAQRGGEVESLCVPRTSPAALAATSPPSGEVFFVEERPCAESFPHFIFGLGTI